VFGLIGKEYKYFHWPRHDLNPGLNLNQTYEQLFHVSVDPFEEYDIFNKTQNEKVKLLQELKTRYAFMKEQSQSGKKI